MFALHVGKVCDNHVFKKLSYSDRVAHRLVHIHQSTAMIGVLIDIVTEENVAAAQIQMTEKSIRKNY